QRVLHVDDDPSGSVGARAFFDGEDGFKKLAARAAVLLGNLDAHKSKLKELVDQRVVEHTLLVHFMSKRTNLVLGKLPDVIAKKNFVLSQRGQGSGTCKLESFGHR